MNEGWKCPESAAADMKLLRDAQHAEHQRAVKAEAERDALRRDAERLDWLDAQRQDEVDWNGHPEVEPVLRYCYWQIQAEAMDIRSAIDEAMKNAPK